jgi:hypothetical protein
VLSSTPLCCAHVLQGIWDGHGAVIVICGTFEANADLQPLLLLLEADEVTNTLGRKASRMLSRKFSVIA